MSDYFGKNEKKWNWADFKAEGIPVPNGLLKYIKQNEQWNDLPLGEQVRRAEISIKMKEIRRLTENPSKRPEVRAKIRKTLTGKKQSVKTRKKRRDSLRKYWSTHKQSENKRRKCREARLRQIHPNKNTSIELIMQKALHALNLEFKTDYPFQCTLMDIAFPEKRVVIYCDGDYWHSLPRVKARDKGINSILMKFGWRVFRFSGTQIRNNPEKCIKEILPYVR